MRGAFATHPAGTTKVIIPPSGIGNPYRPGLMGPDSGGGGRPLDGAVDGDGDTTAAGGALPSSLVPVDSRRLRPTIATTTSTAAAAISYLASAFMPATLRAG